MVALLIRIALEVKLLMIKTITIIILIRREIVFITIFVMVMK